ncbi:MAG: DNA primase [Bacteroidetes bacterium]|nr:DNA primase [Bacteroidota bacterium]MBS1973677.1 DNA primase [Bacteroidota bacterium]
MIAQETIRQILNHIDIVDIVGSFVKLKKRGANYLGLCPFHNEKTPSFTVSPSKEIYKCFGCGRSGNTVSFLMEHEKYSYVETLRWLANKYNIEIEETEASPELKLQQQVAESLYIINSYAQKYFSDILFNDDEGQNIGLSYLKERGFREAIIQKFQLGYCLEQRDAFAKKALASQFNNEYLQKSGLVVMRDDKPADNYRGRIIFPVHNQTGKVIGFGARIIKSNDKAPKYINTPENEIYIKSKILYGSYFARQAIDKNDECLLVEGYTDVISLHQAGIEHVVASGGTSLTQDQLRLIKKYTNNLTIIYDGDAAGIKAALRGLDMALEEGLNVKLVLIPDKEDPDSYVNKIGAAAFRDFVAANKKDFILFQLEVSLKEAGNDSSKKAAVVNQVAETIAKMNKIEDFTRQQDYVQQCAQLLGIEETGLHTLVNKFIREKISKEEFKSAQKNTPPAKLQQQPAEPGDLSDETFNLLFQDELQERAIVRVLLTYGAKQWAGEKTIADYIFEDEIDEEMFKNKKVAEVLKIYKEKNREGQQLSVADFAYFEDSEIVKLVIESTNHPYELSHRWNDEDRAHTINKAIWELKYEEFSSKVLYNKNAASEVFLYNVEDNYRDEADGVMVYLKLKKIKRLILLNEEDLKKPTSTAEEIKHFQEVHMHLKQMQIELGNRKGTIVYPF